MRIAEFARRLGVSRDTVKNWERKGLLAPSRDWNGHRRFAEEQVKELLPLVGRGVKERI